MLSTSEIRGAKVTSAAKPGKEYKKDGVTPRHRKNIGKIRHTVFSPDGMTVVGYIVKRPDLLWMFKRSDKFLSIDAFEFQNGTMVPTMGAQSWDEPAIKRLNLDWDKCILWENMDAKTLTGEELGRVGDIAFDETSGALKAVSLGDGSVAAGLIGTVQVPAALMRGYKNGYLLFDPKVSEYKLSGGVAAKAGEATGKAQDAVRKGNKVATKKASSVIESTGSSVGKAFGDTGRAFKKAGTEFSKEAGFNKKSSKSSEVVKKTSKEEPSKEKPDAIAEGGKAVGKHLKGVGSMFSDFKSEFEKESKK